MLTRTLPLFLLNSVLFPDGRLSLRVFEPRYMDMIARCMQNDPRFGVCLIAEGKEVGAPATPHPVGVVARIVDWDMSQPGVLGITVRGEGRFRVRRHESDEHGLVTADVEHLPEPAVIKPDAGLVPLLQAVSLDAAQQSILPPYRFDDANWVGYRYAEILPIPNLARLKLLELDDAELRLRIIRQFLDERGLLKRGK